MRVSQEMLRILCGAMLLAAAAGCYSYGPPPPYGGYPAYNGQPGPVMIPPGTSYIVPNGSAPGTALTPADDWRTPTPATAGGDAPYYDSNNSLNQPTPAINQPVPTYPDADDFGASRPFTSNPPPRYQPPVSSPPRSATPPAATPRPVTPRPVTPVTPVTPVRPTTPPRSLPGDDAFGPNPKTFDNNDEFNSPFERDGAALRSRPYEETGAPEDRRGQVQPVSTPLQLAASATTVVSADHETAAANNSPPFGHDVANFRWLRGVVDYDADDGSWHIIYDLTPDETDQFGGALMLALADRFDSLRNDDVVLVEGAVDQSRRDSLGKPVYLVQNVQALRPASPPESGPALLPQTTAKPVLEPQPSGDAPSNVIIYSDRPSEDVSRL